MDQDNPRFATLPRRLFRKIVVEPSPGGWRVRAVGFDARFFVQSDSPEFATREAAVAAAKAASRTCGIPAVTIETLTASSGPGRAA